MRTKHLDNKINELEALRSRGELTYMGGEILSEFNEIKRALTIPNVMRSFSLEEVKKIADDIMNLGMELRQNQLNGYDTRSGNEVMKEYFDKM